MATSLYDFFNAGGELTQEQKYQIIDILGHGCRQNTKNRIESCVKYSLTHYVNKYGIFRRWHIEDDGVVRYCAGQSYPDEIRVMRELMK